MVTDWGDDCGQREVDKCERQLRGKMTSDYWQLQGDGERNHNPKVSDLLN